jgi:hypothetical protein
MSATKAHIVAKPFIAAVMSAVLLLLFVPTNLHPQEAKDVSSLILRVDKERHARAFYAGMPVVQSVADFFEFYDRKFDGSRKRTFSGPWGESLSENFTGMYTLAGRDSTTGAEYTVILKQVSANTIELSMTFHAPSPSSNLGFDIVKLSGDLFKGASIEASPVSGNDAHTIPVQPLPVSKRMLLTGKNRVLLKSDVCDLEIKDLMEANTILVADFRNIPWDKSKSIYLGGDKNPLLPTSRHFLRYSIRCLPPSRPNKLETVKTSGGAVSEVNPWSFFSLPPKEEKKDTGYYHVQTGDAIYGALNGTAEKILAKEIHNATSIALDVKTVDLPKLGKGIIIERVLPGKSSPLPPEGFEIVALPEKIVIRGADERGCLYGVYALLGRLTRSSGTWQIACGTIRDWPDLPIRGICMELLPPAIRDVAVAKRYLDAFSRARSNVVIFLHNPPQIRAWLRNTDDGGWTKEQMAQIAQYARSLYMDVWGGMGSGYNSADFRELDVRRDTTFYNPFKEASYGYIFTLYDRILQAYQPSTFLIAHDEIKGLSIYAAESGKSTADVFAADIRKIHDWFNQRKVRTAMWGDMLLDFNKWEAEVGAANSLNPAFNSGATHLALAQIPKDVLILDWHYDERKVYGSIDYFRRNGFAAIGCPWYDPNTAKALAESVRKYGGQGIIATDWGFLRTFSSAATTLYVPLCGWSTACQLDKTNNDVTALAEMVRDTTNAGSTLKEVTTDLRTVSNRSTIDVPGANNNGLFGIGPILDLRALSSGKQVLGGISFDVLPGSGGQQPNCVVVTNTDSKKDKLPREKSVFKGNIQAQAIAFLHTSFVEEPQANLRKMGKYIVDYANGSSTTIDLLENWNITDIRSSEGLRRNDWTFLRSPDVLIGAKLAWRGFSAAGIPLNLQVFIWKNPFPKQSISNIRVSAATAPSDSRIALIGLTFLQSTSSE